MDLKVDVWQEHGPLKDRKLIKNKTKRKLTGNNVTDKMIDYLRRNLDSLREVTWGDAKTNGDEIRGFII